MTYYINIYTYISIYIYTHIYRCTYIYVCTYIHIYIYTYMHTPQVSADSYFNNSLASCEARKKRKLARLFEPRNRRRWSMSIMSVNSYYDNAVNGLFITAGAWRVATHVHVCVCVCVRAERHMVTYTHVCTCICVCKWRVASGDKCAGLLCTYRMHATRVFTCACGYHQ